MVNVLVIPRRDYNVNDMSQLLSQCPLRYMAIVLKLIFLNTRNGLSQCTLLMKWFSGECHKASYDDIDFTISMQLFYSYSASLKSNCVHFHSLTLSKVGA